MSTSPRKGKNKNSSVTEETGSLELLQTVDLPDSIGGPGACTFRSVRCVGHCGNPQYTLKPVSRYHPCNDDVVYTVINASPPRERGRKTPARRGYILKWNSQTWTVDKHKKVGDKGLTAFDIRSVKF